MGDLFTKWHLRPSDFAQSVSGNRTHHLRRLNWNLYQFVWQQFWCPHYFCSFYCQAHSFTESYAFSHQHCAHNLSFCFDLADFNSPTTSNSTVVPTTIPVRMKNQAQLCWLFCFVALQCACVAAGFFFCVAKLTRTCYQFLPFMVVTTCNAHGIVYWRRRVVIR